MFLIETFLFLCCCITGVIAMKRGFGVVIKLVNWIFDVVDSLFSKLLGG